MIYINEKKEVDEGYGEQLIVIQEVFEKFFKKEKRKTNKI